MYTCNTVRESTKIRISHLSGVTEHKASKEYESRRQNFCYQQIHHIPVLWKANTHTKLKTMKQIALGL